MMESIKQTVTSSESTLPIPEVEAQKFLGVFKRLTDEEVVKIISIIIEEVSKSEQFDLHLSEKLLEKEEAFFLHVLNGLGGINDMVQKYEFEDAWFIATELSRNFFLEERKEFYNKFKGSKNGGYNRYSAHLSSVQGAVLNAAYNQ